MKELAISVKGVSKQFRPPHRPSSLKSLFASPFRKEQQQQANRRSVLVDINLEIMKGEFFGIVGRNGSGKSTLLKMLAGIYQPTTGKIRTVGKLVPFIELGVGFNPELTGKDNVYLNGAILGFSKTEIDSMYGSIVEFAELEDYMDQKLKNYSSGMQVRLAFSMAVRSRADILLVDEVLAVGDADFQRKCFEYFRKLKKERKTVIFVSHDMDAVSEYCDRAILIKDGAVAFVGSASMAGDLYRKMFGASSEVTGEVLSADKRWGTKDAVFVDVKLSESAGVSDGYTLRLKVKANKSIEDLVVGFSISNETGTLLFGTNTSIEGTGHLDLQKSQTLDLKWSFPDVFQTGAYFVNIALIKGLGEVTYDWWDEALKFNVIKDRATPYILRPQIEVDMKVGSR